MAMEMNAPVTGTIEKFTATDLSSLREELMQSGLDSWQAAELISSFLNVRGYGVSNHAARGAASRIESYRCSLQCMQEELEKLALVM
jgi:hypothetical protein